MKRSEHLKWAKDRALKETNGLRMWVSFQSDMLKHEELREHIALELFFTIDLMNKSAVEKFIDGFN